MASQNSTQQRRNNNLTESGITVQSDSENYAPSADEPSSPSQSPSPPSSNSAPLILYKPPTFWGLLRGAAINLLLPFVNGLMLGFGELVANEAAFRLGWSGTKVCIYQKERGLCPRDRGGMYTCMDADFMNRYFLRTVENRDGWDRGWRCALILSNGGGEMGWGRRSWICILRWSRGVGWVLLEGGWRI